MSQVYLAEHRGSTNWGERGNQINTNQVKSNVGFWLEGKTRVPGEKPLRAEKRTNKLNPHMMSDPGIGHHMWATLVEG